MDLSVVKVLLVVAIAIALGAVTTLVSNLRTGLTDDATLIDVLRYRWRSLGRRNRALVIVSLWFVQSVVVLGVAGATIGYFISPEDIGIWPFAVCAYSDESERLIRRRRTHCPMMAITVGAKRRE